MNSESTSQNLSVARAPTLVRRSLLGGILMGLANLVPGISGGTMLLSAGIYPDFIESLSQVTRLRFTTRSLLVLVTIAVAAGLAILLGAGAIKTLVVEQRWIMYSLFIGLTLGGVPLVWRLSRGCDLTLALATAGAMGAMVGLAWLDNGNQVAAANSSFPMLLVAGLAGASAMVLPGLSGSYLLLLLGQYVPILNAIDQFKEALRDRNWSAAMGPALEVILPVGLGVVVGIVLVGNLLKWLMERYRQATLGILLGLLLGSVVGLYPFQRGVAPQAGDVIAGQVVTAENLSEFEPEKWRLEKYPPRGLELLASLGLIGLGYAVTWGVGRWGGNSEAPSERHPEPAPPAGKGP